MCAMQMAEKRIWKKKKKKQKNTIFDQMDRRVGKKQIFDTKDAATTEKNDH